MILVMNSDLCFLPATKMLHLLSSKQLSSEELVRAHLKRNELVNPKVMQW